MTSFKPILISTAAVIGFAATPAFAGDHSAHKNSVKMHKAQDANRVLTRANDTPGEVLQADGQKAVQSDYELLNYDGKMVHKAKTSDVKRKAIVVPSPSSNAVTTVKCPKGTTAQPDMTCLVTGDFTPLS